MNKALSLTLISAFSIATAACAAGTNNQTGVTPSLEGVAPFPAAQEGQTRNVIWLSEQANEDMFKVELVPGQVMLTDCNTRSLVASLTENELSGWGYTYYEVGDVRGPITTMMACPEGTEKEAFVAAVAADGDSFTVRYNSQLPIVVYAPENIEVRYRIWTGSEQLQLAVEQ